MNKSELIDELATKSEVSKKQAAVMLEALISTVTETLSDGDQVVLPGFGTFSIGLRAARKGRNPKTGETVPVSARRVVTFRASQKVKEDVSANTSAIASQAHTPEAAL